MALLMVNWICVEGPFSQIWSYITLIIGCIHIIYIFQKNYDIEFTMFVKFK